MSEWETVLQDLADTPGDYCRAAGEVMFVRHGIEHVVKLREVPGLGVSVVPEGPAGTHATSPVPVSTYVQRDLLDLPRLARQMVKALDAAFAKRPGNYVDGPAAFTAGQDSTNWAKTSEELIKYLPEPEAGMTRLIQLMAPAGQGKTVLLERLSLHSARTYQPDPFPTPILLTVDLLGRYVGTVDDAIAGSLNNTYLFPGLTQRELVLCMKKRWLLLALDGFDELVARIGVRDAFNRVTEVLDQLDGSGTIVLSARESFFELYQITSAVRTYLQPKTQTGSYSTSVVKLLPWAEVEGIAVFTGLASTRPQEDLAELLAAFDGDRRIVLHPFFLTRLADLWMRGERFSGAGALGDPLTRAKYVIETFIQRESGEKWVNRDGTPLLDPKGHTVVLAGIADEMWRSGAFRLSVDELRIAGEIALSRLGLAKMQIEQVLERLPTHAALVSKDRGVVFLHDRFLHYFLGYRIAELLCAKDDDSLETMLSAREMAPGIVDWVVWCYASLSHNPTSEVVALISNIGKESDDGTLRDNIARLCAGCLRKHSGERRLTVRNLSFQGDALTEGRYTAINFEDCHFWQLDLSHALLSNCRFLRCRFGDMQAGPETRVMDTEFVACQFRSLEMSDATSVFSPDAVVARLKGLGASIVMPTTGPEEPPPPQRVDPSVVACIEKFVRASERTCDVVLEEMEERYGQVATSVAKIAQRCDVLREVTRGASGTRKTFVRFRIDRSKLLRGQVEKTGDQTIDAFWDQLRRSFPAH